MDFNTTLRWLSIAGSVALLLRWRAVFRQRRSLGWAAVAVGILAVNAVGAFLFPDTAGSIAGGLWIAFILVPSLLMRSVMANATRGRFDRASRLARVISILHPADTWLQQPTLYRALALAQRGEMNRAAALLRGLLERPGIPDTVKQTAQAYLYRLLGQWEELLAWLQTAPPRRSPGGSASVSISELTLFGMRLRALGETGRVSEMLAVYQAGFLQMEHFGGANALAQCLLFVLAFAGREEALARLLGGSLAPLPPELKRFWLATAQIAAGRPAQAELRALAAATSDASLKVAIARRLGGELPARPVTFSRAETLTLDFIETKIQRDAPYQPEGAAGLRRAYVTLTLIALNAAAYVGEVAAGGGEDTRVLYRLGALWRRRWSRKANGAGSSRRCSSITGWCIWR